MILKLYQFTKIQDETEKKRLAALGENGGGYK